ncbi:hypothetical protein DO72_5452 [Burkholderia pseudomallei]|nr:hypothetical protein DO72_5452 [Burkholderia pseudomallei]
MLPPRASPSSRIISTSCAKPNVRARAISRTYDVFAKSTSSSWPVLSTAGWRKSIVNFSLKPKYGSRRANLSPSRISTGFVTLMNFFAAFCSSMPADWIRNTNVAALPSMIGISSAVTST